MSKQYIRRHKQQVTVTSRTENELDANGNKIKAGVVHYTTEIGVDGIITVDDFDSMYEPFDED